MKNQLKLVKNVNKSLWVFIYFFTIYLYVKCISTKITIKHKSGVSRSYRLGCQNHSLFQQME